LLNISETVLPQILPKRDIWLISPIKSSSNSEEHLKVHHCNEMLTVP